MRSSKGEHGPVLIDFLLHINGDMSRRMMQTIATISPRVSVYSIDELFSICDGMSDEQLYSLALQIRARVREWTGLGVGIGVGPTLTLAKLANYAAKRVTKTGLCILMSRADREDLMRSTPVSEVWGIGKAIASKLTELNVHTIDEFIQLPASVIDREFPVTVRRTQAELMGVNAIDLQDASAPRQMINVSRSFGSPVHDPDTLAKALCCFTEAAAAKLRRQGSVTSVMRVYALSSPFSTKGIPYSKAVTIPFAYPVDDVRALSRAASQAARVVFRQGVSFAKGGVTLMQISPRGHLAQADMFYQDESRSSEQLMHTLDEINSRFGRNTVVVARSIGEQAWSSRHDNRSQAFSTSLAEFKVVT